MEIYPAIQLAALGFSALLGVALGFVYDLLRPSRRRSGKLRAAIIDIVYALISAAACFVCALSAPGGRLGVWELGFSALGFLAYIWLLSDSVYRLSDGAYVFCKNLLRSLKQKCVKFLDMTKLFFQNVQK